MRMDRNPRQLSRSASLEPLHALGKRRELRPELGDRGRFPCRVTWIRDDIAARTSRGHALVPEPAQGTLRGGQCYAVLLSEIPP